STVFSTPLLGHASLAGVLREREGDLGGQLATDGGDLQRGELAQHTRRTPSARDGPSRGPPQGLGAGSVTCQSHCIPDFSGCANPDWCAAHNLVGNFQCDPCDLLGGAVEPDCASRCSQCADTYLNGWTCDRLGLASTNCDTC